MDSDPHIAEHNPSPELVVVVVAASSMGHICLCSQVNLVPHIVEHNHNLAPELAGASRKDRICLRSLGTWNESHGIPAWILRLVAGRNERRIAEDFGSCSCVVAREDLELTAEDFGSCNCVVAREDLELAAGRSHVVCVCVVVGEGESHVKAARRH